MSKRRQYTEEQKAEVIAFANENGIMKAAAKFGIVHSVIHRWRTNGIKPKARKYARRSPAERNHLDTISFLKRAWKCHVNEARDKGTLSMAAIYTRLALNSLTGEAE